MKFRGIRSLIGRHDPRTERSAVMEVLSWRPLRAVPLKISDAAVVETAVSGDIVHCAVPADVTSLLADDYGKLALEIVPFRCEGPNHCFAVADDTVREAYEQHGVVRSLASHLLDVRHVIDSDAQQFGCGIRDGRQEFDIV